ncbi:endonuclease NucS domain-containing protein [Priestia aryabhattai]|uniref:endonuclease NucS domain-containing protein n=1 Tax=Priestia aryabhattai TaxID=412384 RepID=UPI003D2E1D84
MFKNLRNYLVPYNQKDEEDPVFSEYTYGHQEFELSTVEKGEYIFFHAKILDDRYITAYYQVFDKLFVSEIKQDPHIVSKYKNHHIRNGNDSDIIIFGHPVYSHILQKPVRLTKELREKLVGAKSIDRPRKVIMNEGVKEYLLEEIQKQQLIPLQDVALTTNDIYHLRESDIENLIQNKPQILGESFTFTEKQKVLKDRTRLDLLLKDEKGLVIIEIKKGLIGPEVYEQIKGYIDKVKELEPMENVRGIIVCRGFDSEHSQSFYTGYISKGKIEVYVHAWKFDLKKIDAVDVIHI